MSLLLINSFVYPVQFKLEDIAPNQSTILPSAPAVMAAVNLAGGAQRRISSGPNARKYKLYTHQPESIDIISFHLLVNASNQSLNSVGRPVSAPSETINNSAYVTPPARRYTETSSAAAAAAATTTTGAAATTTTATPTTANSVSASSANHAAAASSHDDKGN